MYSLLIFSCFITCSFAQSDAFIAINTICQGWFCEQEYLTLVSFSYANRTANTLATIYPLSEYKTVEALILLATYDSTVGRYFALVQDPGTSTATLWSVDRSMKVTKVNIAHYGITAIAFDSASGYLLAVSSGLVYRIHILSGRIVFYFALFDSKKNPALATSDNCNLAFNSPNLNAKVQYQDEDNDPGACFYIYTLAPSKNQTPVVSPCFPNYDAWSSLTQEDLIFLYQNPTQPPETNFFMVTYNTLGPNYGYYYPSNFSVINMVLDFTDFAGLGWDFSGDSTSFSYNAQTSNMWGSFSTSSISNALCGVTMNSANLPTYCFDVTGYSFILSVY